MAEFWVALNNANKAYVIKIVGYVCISDIAKLTRETINFVMFVCPSVCASVRMEQLCSAKRIFITFDLLGVSDSLSRKRKFD
jgi:hypothetical protein